VKIAVAGATGYIGSRLVPLLLDRGHQVVCLARTPGKLDDRPWRAQVEVRRADVLSSDDMIAALAGCDAAYYLIHSMGEQADFADADRTAAGNFVAGAAHNDLSRIVYLGGLGEGADLSKHLESRQEVGRVLARGATPVTELRASVVIGSGSVSFEMLRYLTEVLPVMVTPRWVDTLTQPIAISDVLDYLVAVLDDEEGHHVYEVGGPDVLTYREMMHTYARIAGLRRRLIFPVPVLTPRLSSLWIGLVTPLPSGVARPLVDSLRNEVVVRDPSAQRFGLRPLGLEEAIARALEHDQVSDVPSRWSDANSSPARPFPSDPEWAGGSLLEDRQTLPTTADADDLFWAFSRIGGKTGYYTFDWAWRVRGLIDTLVGGVGLRRGRRHPVTVRVGDSVDFWRVSSVETSDHLQLFAEMRLPGEAWLEWRIREEDGRRHLDQTARFRPRGLAGRLYWYAMFPFHRLIFGRMARRVVAAAEHRT
jgi:uncharacterized protein YbjT (DUF2867 family)